MSEYLENFKSELEHINNTFNLMSTLELLRSQDLPNETSDSQFIIKAVELHHKFDTSREGLRKIPGIFILFIGGRFEDFVKTIFEEFAIQFAQKHQNYTSLPEKFKSTIINNTTQVITSPRKFGFENLVQNTFIENLYKNVINNDISSINHQCLSITSGNLRSDILSDLFKIISVDNIWNDIGQQVSIRTFFETSDPKDATKEAKNLLDEFMNIRNSIAHPKGANNSWPSEEKVIYFIDYFKILAPVLVDLGNMNISSITPKNV